MNGSRALWADMAKGLSIVFVVYGHAAVGVQIDFPLPDWAFDTFVRPFSLFRMPLFFFVAGLFAARSVRRDWRDFIDRTLLHLVYVFIVWNVLQYASRVAFAGFANHAIDSMRILWFPLWPINITWFIWALILYYTILRLGRDLPPVLLVAAAAVMFAVPLGGEHYALQQSSRFMLFFVLGYACADWVVAMTWRPGRALVGLGLLAYLGACLVALHSGAIAHPLVELAVRVSGVAAVLAACMHLAAAGRGAWLAWLGRYTLPIFVMHTIVTAAVREVLLRTGLVTDPVVLILLATLCGVALPLAFHLTMQRLGMPWLFERPAWFSLPRTARPALVEA